MMAYRANMFYTVFNKIVIFVLYFNVRTWEIQCRKKAIVNDMFCFIEAVENYALQTRT